jgi:zinc/manganese transport system substrate-binding protein
MDTLLKTFCAGFALTIALAVSPPASAALNVLACEPEWASLTREIAGDKVSVSSATTALQDPHRIEARPSLLARARSADLLVCTGADLEIGWLPLLMSQSGNGRIQPGRPGYLEASQHVARMEIPKVIDRALGDIHPAGNPHIHTDPRNIAKVAEVLTERLAQLDPANADTYRGRSTAFLERWRSSIERWQGDAAPLKGASIVTYHKDFSYLQAWLGLVAAGTLEPKPGIPPTPGHLAELVSQMQRRPANAVIYAAYQDPQPAQFLSQRAKIPATMLPFTVGGTDRATDLFALFDDTIARLLSVLK